MFWFIANTKQNNVTSVTQANAMYLGFSFCKFVFLPKNVIQSAIVLRHHATPLQIYKKKATMDNTFPADMCAPGLTYAHL